MEARDDAIEADPESEAAACSLVYDSARVTASGRAGRKPDAARRPNLQTIGRNSMKRLTIDFTTEQYNALVDYIESHPPVSRARAEELAHNSGTVARLLADFINGVEEPDTNLPERVVS